VNPRIGDTVHYVPQLGPDHDCLAALIFSTDRDGTDASVCVWTRSGDQYYAYPTLDTHTITDEDGDTWPGPNGYTPGTWHPLH
jgi:uncharacterized protein YfaP (DUF2135 family)